MMAFTLRSASANVTSNRLNNFSSRSGTEDDDEGTIVDAALLSPPAVREVDVDVDDGADDGAGDAEEADLDSVAADAGTDAGREEGSKWPRRFQTIFA